MAYLLFHLFTAYQGPRPAFGILLFKRIMSALLVIISLVADWIEYVLWAAKEDTPDWMNIIEKPSKGLSVDCENSTPALVAVYALLL